MKHEVLGLIPARGGSKGVPHKNRRLVAGKPLISYSIDAALFSKRLTQIVVSTDDPEIAEIARGAGVTLVDRPSELAGDASPVIDAVRHALQSVQNRGFSAVDGVVLLQPTTPLRTADDIDRAVDLYFLHGRKPVCSVYRCEDNHPARMYTIEHGRLLSLMPEMSAMRRQDLPHVYHRNGALYVFGQRQVDDGTIIDRDMTPYVMSQHASVNIDTELDFILLEAILANRK